MDSRERSFMNLQRNAEKCWQIGDVIQKWQIKNNVSNKELALRARVSVRGLQRVKAGGAGIRMIEKNIMGIRLRADSSANRRLLWTRKN